MTRPSGLLVQTIRGVTCVTFTESSVLDAAAIDRYGRQLYPLVEEQDRRKIVLDMTNVEFLSSAMIGVVLNLHNKLKAIKGDLAICGLRPELMKVFQITKLDKLLKFYPDEDAALASFDVFMK